MPKKIIFSLDYDGNACILFKNAIEEGRFGQSMPYYSNQSRCLETARKVFEEFIEKSIANFSNNVELYVGSARQCRRLDLSNSVFNENGCCFTNYATLAEEKGWIFRKLLLADLKAKTILKEEKWLTGLAMGPLKKNAKGCYEYEADSFADQLFSPDDSRKIQLLTLQLADVAINHPDTEIEFIFTDDDPYIIEALKEYFTESENIYKIPFNVSLKLVHYEWLSLVKAYRENDDFDAAKLYPLFKAALGEKFIGSHSALKQKKNTAAFFFKPADTASSATEQANIRYGF